MFCARVILEPRPTRRGLFGPDSRKRLHASRDVVELGLCEDKVHQKFARAILSPILSHSISDMFCARVILEPTRAHANGQRDEACSDQIAGSACTPAGMLWNLVFAKIRFIRSLLESMKELVSQIEPNQMGSHALVWVCFIAAADSTEKP
jgi:hypothetical protein